MAAKIQIASGDLTSLKQSRPETGNNLIPAELFWQAKSDDYQYSAKYDDTNNNIFQRYDEGTLYIGRPSLSNDLEEPPIPIGGTRSYKSFVFKGYLSNGSVSSPYNGAKVYYASSIASEVFNHARTGDLYIWLSDAGGYKDTIDSDITPFYKNGFRNTDALVIIDNGGEKNINTVTGEIIDHKKIKYVLLKYSSSSARNIAFTQDDTLDGQPWPDFGSVNTVQNGLLTLQKEKLEWCGEINSQSEVPIPSNTTIGGLWLVTADDIEFNFVKTSKGLQKTVNSNINESAYFVCDKGDFVYWHQDFEIDEITLKATVSSNKGYWVRIPSGYTNADEIDYYDNDRIEKRTSFISSLHSTFTEAHKQEFLENSDNVHKTLDFLVANKAELDEQGKIPLSQLHDTVLGALQFKGKWQPLKNKEGGYKVGIVTDPDCDIFEYNGKYFLRDINNFNPLPSYGHYEDGDGKDKNDTNKPHQGDYYVVDFSNVVISQGNSIINLQWTTKSYNTDEDIYPDEDGIFEVNPNDWIVYCSSDAQDKSNTNGAVYVSDGYWTIIDNSDRLSALQYEIDTTSPDGFRDDSATPSQLTLVGTPILKATNKIGLYNAGNNTVIISGHSLIDQLREEASKERFYPRYNNTTGTIENSLTEDRVANKNQVNTQQSDNLTIMHGNVQVGTPIEHRDETIYGNLYVKPQIKSSDTISTRVKSYVELSVNNLTQIGSPDETEHKIRLFAQNGSSEYGITEKLTADEIVNLALPEKTSTLIGMLAGVNLNSTRITKSTVDGYIESTSIEEHINTPEEDHNHHDNLNNYVEFHSQVSTPINNTYEIWFGKHKDVDYNEDNLTPELSKGTYSDNNFTDTGDLLETNNVKVRLTNSKFQTKDTIHVSLPASSGIILTQENLASLLNDADDTYYLSMFGNPKTIDNHKSFNALQRAPIILIKDLLKTRLKSNNFSTSEIVANMIVSKPTDDTFDVKPTVGSGENEDGTSKIDTDRDTLSIESNILAGVVNKNTGEIQESRSIIATKAIGVSNEKGTGLLFPQRTNHSDAPQYKKPHTGEPTEIDDVLVDMPNESGVMLTNNSLITGGIWLPDVDYSINTEGDSDSIPDEVVSVEVIGNSGSYNVGDVVQLSAKVVTTGSAIKSVFWLSNDTSIATVSETGKVNFLKNGEVTITAKSYWNNEIYGVTTITVINNSENIDVEIEIENSDSTQEDEVNNENESNNQIDTGSNEDTGSEEDTNEDEEIDEDEEIIVEVENDENENIDVVITN